MLSSSRYFASSFFTCFKNCSSIGRACGPSVRSSRSSASSSVAGRSKSPGVPISILVTLASAMSPDQYSIGASL